MAHPFGNVGILLDKMDEHVGQLDAMYTRDLTAQTVSDELLYLIRSIIQDALSALDWTANEVKERFGTHTARSPYFPVGADRGTFDARLDEQIPGLRMNHSRIADVFERHQPYHPDKTVLSYLHALAKVNKHRDFTPQTRIETRRVRAESVSGGVVEWGPGVTFGGNVSISGVPIDPVTQRPIPDPRLRVTETVYIDWLFTDPPVLVRQTLHSLAAVVRVAVEDIRSTAGL